MVNLKTHDGHRLFEFESLWPMVVSIRPRTTFWSTSGLRSSWSVNYVSHQASNVSQDLWCETSSSISTYKISVLRSYASPLCFQNRCVAFYRRDVNHCFLLVEFQWIIYWVPGIGSLIDRKCKNLKISVILDLPTISSAKKTAGPLPCRSNSTIFFFHSFFRSQDQNPETKIW